MISPFGFNLEGYLANEKLPVSKPLIPLFEAISNAIHATEDANAVPKRVKIHIVRETGQLDLDTETVPKGNNPIIGFIVTDNGIGFDQSNFASFTTSYSQYKKERGGKGVGRLSWLKAFEYVNIESIYKEEDLFKDRFFKFSKEGVEPLDSPEEPKEGKRYKIYPLDCLSHLG